MPTTTMVDAPATAIADGRAQQAAIGQGAQTRAGLVRGQMQLAHRENARLRAFSSLVPIDRAVAQAAALDRQLGRTLRSGVDGLTLSVKGCIPVAGQLWTEGSRLFAARTADHSAEAVRRLTAAGTIFVGTTTLTELALYAPDNPFEPVARNPWAPARTPGGSTSGGGAAAAIGAAALNLGTDSGGSIRNPACHCGVVGFKPTMARWPLAGVPSYTPSLSALGIIARSAPDVIAVDQTLTSDGDRSSSPGVTLLVPERLVADHCHEVTQRLFAAALDGLRRHGFRIEKIDEPLWEAGERAAGIVSISEAAAHLQDADKSLMAPALAERLRLGTTIDQVAMAHAAMAALRSSLLRQVAPGSVILTPTWPFRAPRIHQTSVVVRGKRLSMDPHRNIFVRAANAADAPALTLPAGFYPGHVPFGLQLMAPQGRDRELLATAASVAHAIAGDAAWCEA